MSDRLIVSYSELVKFQTCERQHWYRFGEDLQPQTETDAVDTGKKGHKLLQDFYELMRMGHSKEEALAIVKAKAGREMASEEVPDFNKVIAWTLIENYITETDFTSEVTLIENRFLFPASRLTDDPFYEGVYIGFTPDVVFERKGGFLDIEDAKFIQRAWGFKKIERFPQAKLYQVFMKAMNYNVSRTIIRFFNVKTGALTFKNYTLGSKEAANLTRDFLRGIVPLVETKRGPREIFAQAPRTMNMNACQYCSYAFICGLEAEGKDASKSMKAEFKKSTYDYTR